ncbi:MAG TPA: SUF system NifU family Fe-S cluster assembly protein [Vicinamibacterales bacterium]|nr:SUF system NifU family Fe-S cluster assembly protein [Vicinamibacterales bacterium]
MDGLQELYQEVILDHNRRPRNFRAIAGGTRQEGYNPLCGDRLVVYVVVADGVVTDVAFEGSGCAIAKASASLMTEALRGQPIETARQLFADFHALITSPPAAAPRDLGKLSVLAGVREFPTRVKCASLAWHAVKAALDGAAHAPVSTE